MDSSPLSLPAFVRAITPTPSLARTITPTPAHSRVITPAPVSTPTPTPPAPAPDLDLDHLPQNTKPSRIKIKELPEEERKRAEFTATQLSITLDDARVRAALSHISKVRDESHIRPKRGDRTGWAVLQVEKRQHRDTMLTEARTDADTPSRRPPRLAVSAPVMLKDSLVRPVPGSPMGNAWSGEHFWKPDFCESVPASPIWEEGGCAHSDAVRQSYYDSVDADVEKCALEVKVETAQSGEQMSDAEYDVIAAMTVLEEMKAGFGEDDWPVPNFVLAKTRQFSQEEKKTLDLNTIRNLADIQKSDNWLSFEPSSLQPLTKLDEVRGRLKMIKETKRNSGIDPSEQGYRLVYAVQILEEKIKTLRLHDRYADNSDDDMMEYGMFLKSLAEVVPAEEDNGSTTSESSDSELEERRYLRSYVPEIGLEKKRVVMMDVLSNGLTKRNVKRDVSESGLDRRRLLGKGLSTLAERGDLRREVSESGMERRRLRGKAPSTLDLESWASSLKVLDDKKADTPRDENLFF
ncbi:hypothetical protein PMIN06_007241 [Paraphaeosphaeria minitans]|uniref:Uncharacterized protein n=1 Tax=Paraphaeosphaeria minitans TaxID=565426 RepID=A0A9P6KPI4_9PLEO|nr:hypothetical protein PMIN01_07972 [Paraphaeosphaeria minitans]